MTEDSHLAVEWSQDDEPHAVPIVHFDFNQLDSLEDIARERLAAGLPLQPLLEDAATSVLESGDPRLVARLTDRIYRAAWHEMVSRFILLVLNSEAPRFTLTAMAHEIGATWLNGETVPQSASKFGKRKQALFQEMERVREAIKLRLPRSNQRSGESCEKMRKSNFRKKG